MELVKKSYTTEDLIKSNSIAYFFYKLTGVKEPLKNASILEKIIYYIIIKVSHSYLTYLSLRNFFVKYTSKYFPFSSWFRGDLNHYSFRIERKIIGYFELMGYGDKIYMSIKGFDSDKAYVYYVGFFNFKVDLEKEIKKLQKTVQKVNSDFFVREYEDGWFKIMIPWNKYLELRKEYED